MSDTMTPELAGYIEATQWTESLRAAVSETVQGVLLRGARAVQVGTADGATTRPTTAPGVLMGYAVRAGAAGATVQLRDGENGPLLVPLTLAANECADVWFGPGGVNLVNGLTVETTAGAIDGCVYLGGPQ